MKVWNVSEEPIKQFYNRKEIVIAPNAMIDINDDAAVFLLGKREIRGKGLVQVKDGDNKEERYAEGRLNIYNRAKLIYGDYERHTEERESVNLKAAPMHEPIVKAKKLMEEYEKWVNDGKPIKQEILETGDEKKVYVCPYCDKEFSMKVAYHGHMRSHQKEKVDVHAGTVSNKGEGEG